MSLSKRQKHMRKKPKPWKWKHRMVNGYAIAVPYSDWMDGNRKKVLFFFHGIGERTDPYYKTPYNEDLQSTSAGR